MRLEIIKSTIDKSINFIARTDDGGMLESRYVSRSPGEAIIYVSSATGCAKSCRMCWLTQTRQTMDRPATPGEIAEQMRAVLESDAFKEKHSKISVSFMARGEPLANPHIIDGDFTYTIKKTIDQRFGFYSNVIPKIKVSTIFPNGVTGKENIFHNVDVRLYYSLYSFNESFRKRWLPKAAHPTDALSALKRHVGEVVVHGAFIAGENDSPDDVRRLIGRVEGGLGGKPWRFNLVRFNPAPGQPYEESKALDRIEGQFCDADVPFKWITRVGPDVKASCGMFLSENLP